MIVWARALRRPTRIWAPAPEVVGWPRRADTTAGGTAMAQVEATTERIIAADAETVFDALADYTGTRGKLLPEHFSEYEVREGGDGEGTLVHWKLQATSKRVRDCLLEVSEP